MEVKKITRHELIDAVYQNTKCEKRVVQEVVDSLLNELKKSLSEGNTIELRGFGTFEARRRKGRVKARNPKTGEELSVAPHYVAAFRAGMELKKSLLKLDATEQK